MQLTQFTDYSLRALIYIALRNERCTINDIACAYNISNNHLVKIIHNLSRLGVVKTSRGKNGGIGLNVEPADVNLGALVVQLEPNFDLVPCFNKEEANCCIAPACRLKQILDEAGQAFRAVLYRYTLADILANPQQLGQLLNISAQQLND